MKNSLSRLLARALAGVLLAALACIHCAFAQVPLPASNDPNIIFDTPPAHDATVGTLAGQAATDGGASTYSAPIVVPPGRAGMQPSLALTYNSRAGDGVMGLGWSISGLSSIHRCPQTLEQDGQTLGVSYTMNDRLCLDGQRLVQVDAKEAYGSAGAEYRTEVDSYARILQVGGNIQSGTACFRVEQKSGQILHYGAVVLTDRTGTILTCATGSTAHSRVVPDGVSQPLSWLVEKVEDRVGNNQFYTYIANADPSEVLLYQIKYTGFGTTVGDRIVQFTYVDRSSAVTTSGASQATDKTSSYLAGGLTMQMSALQSIDTYAAGAHVRSITPTYSASTYSGRLMVAALKECAFPDVGSNPVCHPVTQFTSNNQQASATTSVPTFNLSSLSSLNLPQAVHKPRLSPQEEATAVRQRKLRAFAAPMTDPVIGPTRLVQEAGDFDGDGTREMAFAISQADGLQHDYLVQLAADRQVRGAVDVTGKLCFNTDCYGDFAGDGRSESVIMPRTTSDPADIRFGVWTAGRGAIATPGTQPIQLLESNIPALPYFPSTGQPAPLWAAPHVVDVDGDGRLDIVIEESGTAAVASCGSVSGHPLSGVVAYLNDTTVDPVTHTLSLTHPPHFMPPQRLFCLSLAYSNGALSHIEHIDHISDFDGDGLPDFFVTDSFAGIGDPSLTSVKFTKVTGTGATRVVSTPVSQTCAGIGLVNSDGSNGTPDDCRWSNGYAVHWMDVNGDGLDDFVIARPLRANANGVWQGVWHVRLNRGGQQGNELGPDIPTTGAGSNAGLDTYLTGGPNAQVAFNYANRLPVMDVDGDGKTDLLIASSFAVKLCTVTLLAPSSEECLGLGETGGTCPAYGCPVDPGTGTFTMPQMAAPGTISRWQGRLIFPMYGAFSYEGMDVPDEAGSDASSYHLAQIKFVQTGPTTIEARRVETSLVSSMIEEATPPVADVFGDGLSDLLGDIGCQSPPISIPIDSNPAHNVTVPGCLNVDTPNFGPQSLQVYSSPTASAPTSVPTSSFATDYSVFLNQNIGDGLVGGESSVMAELFNISLREPSGTTTSFVSPFLPDLLANVVDGIGDYTAWSYSPLSLPLVQGNVPLYTVPSTNGYNDTRHYYFTSSMPVVAGTVGNNGIGDQFGFRAALYGYSEAMYNHMGRGFQGFRTITSGVGTTNADRQVLTTTTYNQKFPLTGKIASACSYLPPHAPLAAGDVCNTTTGPIEFETESDTWICGTANRSACPQGDSLLPPTSTTIYAPLLDKRRINRFDLGTGAAQGHTEIVNAATATATASGWDATYGNLKDQIVTSADDGAGGIFINSQTVATHNEYAAADPSWWIDKLNTSTKSTAVTYGTGHSLPGGGTPPPHSVTTKYQWNSPDRTPLSQTVQDTFPGQQRTTTYAYPTTSYGLPSSVTINAPSAVPASRTTSFTYTKGGATTDADGYFVLTTTNPLFQITTTQRSPKDGQVTLMVDPNNLTTNNAYDAFRRITQTQFSAADASQLYPSRSISMTRCSGDAVGRCPASGADSFGEDGNQAYAAYRVATVQTGHPSTADWFDALGRRIKHVERGFTNDNFVGTVTEYDDMNTVANQSTPYYIGDVPYLTALTYDALSRPTKKQAPGAEMDPAHGDVVTDYTYNGTKTSIKVHSFSIPTGSACTGSTNLCMDMTRSYDVLGHLEQTVQGLGNRPTYATTNYWYDGAGNPIAAVDAEGNITKAAYNDIGQRTDMFDPDAGHTQFAYDALGELLTQTDARGVVTAHIYDALGRLTQRTATNATATDPSLKVIKDVWVYDPTGPTGGKGLLGNLQRSKGATAGALTQIWNEAYNYEQYTKRPSSQVSTLDGQPTPWTTSFSYDAWGREALLGYPTGLVQYTLFTAYGRVQGLQNADATHLTWWTHSAEDAWGNVTAETFLGTMNGAHQTYASTGQIKEKKWSRAAGVFEQLDYTYDSFGNLTRQTRGADQTPWENFVYDNLQRLTQRTFQQPPTANCATQPLLCPPEADYTFSPSGNISSKTDYAVSYQYGINGCGPHGVGQATTLLGTVTYTCDASGNVVGGNTLAATYDFNNQPWSVTRSQGSTVAGSAQFEYDPNGNRFREQATSVSTWFGPRGYEHSVAAQTTDRHEVGPVVIDRNGSTDTIYYQLRDRLGSTIAMGTPPGAFGTTPVYRSYDPFGGARDAEFAPYTNGTLNLQPKTLRGFTGQEHVDDVWLIHMNGRMYDYQLGRFLSVDPVIQFPSNTQSLNPYSYVLNNPLSGKDPTGYMSCDVGQTVGSGPGDCNFDPGSDNKIFNGDQYLGKVNADKNGNATSFSSTPEGAKFLAALKANGANPGQSPEVEPQRSADEHGGITTLPPSSVGDVTKNLPYGLGVDPYSDLNIDQQTARWMAPGVGFVQCATGDVGCSGGETAKQGLIGVAQVAVGQAAGYVFGKVAAWWAGAADGAATEGQALFKNLAPADEIAPPTLFPASQIQKVGYSGRLNYVVTESGELVIGRTGHTSLSQGADVLAAGEARFVNGSLRSLDNASGHYQTSGMAARSAAESAFQKAGFDAAGKYTERSF